MQEADEQDTCRICSAPAEPDQPLFHPCKCAGTIRYIHQDCLTTWLAHSKKKNCDVCKHPYSFTKVYAPDMPSSLPPLLLLRRLVQHFFLALLFVLRGFAVAVIWLGVLPWVTVWTWRMYFSMGESIAWWVSNRPKPASNDTPPFFNRLRSDQQIASPKSLFGRVTTHPLWVALSADIFTGQIIASMIVLTFVAIFLLREWISQNARPGVFEDEEAMPDDPILPPVPPQPPNQDPVLPPAQPRHLGLHNLNVRRQQHAPLPPIQPPPQVPDPRLDSTSTSDTQGRPFDPVAAADPDQWEMEEDDELPTRHRRKRTKVEKDPRSLRLREQDEDFRRQMFHRRIHTARAAAARRRVYTNAKRAAAASASTTPTSSESSSPARSSNPFSSANSTFQFSAATGSTADSNSIASWPSSSQPAPSPPGASPPSTPLPAFPPSALTGNSRPTDFPFPPVALQRPSDEIPFSLRLPNLPSPPPYPTRPPLPTVSLPPVSGSSSPFLYSPSRTGKESPSLATYRPPEELVDAPSDYFDHGGDEDDDSPPERYSRDGYEGVRVNNPPGKSSGKGKEKQVLGAEEGGLEQNGRLSRLSDGDDDMQAEHDRYFGDETPERIANGDQLDSPVPSLRPLSDSSESTDDEERDAALEPAFEDDEFLDHPEAEADGDIFEFDDNADWVDADVDRPPFQGEAAQPEAQVNAAANQAAARPGDQDAEGGLDLGDDLDGNAEDDMEGAMEAIGMRGPVFGVFQNAALMIFVLDTAIGLCIWIPFTIGKTTALLSLDPRRMLGVLHLPIQLMRLVTDPIVDLVAYIITDIVFPAVLSVFGVFFRLFMFFGSNSLGKLLNVEMTDTLAHMSSKLYNESTEFINLPLNYIVAWTTTSNITEPITATPAPPSFIDQIPDHLGFTEPYFIALGAEVREVATKAQTSWIRFALGTGPANRASSILLGYTVVTFLFSLYLNVLTVGNARTAGIAVRNAIRQQMLVLKVATFIFIELVIFPLGCGVVLDLCTVWLFPEANMHSRVAFFGQAPLTAMFYHWVAGTMFMYTFAVLLSGCRSVMRPGAMWFIKDPQDQNSHPIRDILDRPTLVQLRKIFVSGLMYSFVVACVVGSVAGLLVMGSKSIMPFRWKNREPLSDVPVDLLFLHLVLPYTMHYFRPKKAVKELATVVWKFLATRLRLTSYFFGGRHPQEEFTPSRWQDNFSRPEISVEGTMFDGTFRRVPATDNLALPREMRATVAVTETGIPVDDEAKKLMDEQNAEAEKAKRNVKDDYMIVYMPPHFRWRIIAFITFLWIIGAISVGFAVAVPVSLGRSFFRLFTTRDVHDGYSFILGFYLVWLCYLAARAIDRLDRRRMRRGHHGIPGGSGSGDSAPAPRADLRVLVVKRGLLWSAKTAYMMFFLGVVIPILLAIVVDLYIVLPIRLSLNPGMVPTMRIVDQWALGLLYAKIGLYAQRIQPPNRITRGVQHIMVLGWTRPDPIMATQEVIAPVIGGLLGMIIFPGAMFRAVQYCFPALSSDNRFIFMSGYPSVFIFAAGFRTAVTGYGMLSAWSQAIRDKEFLVEMRLRNHEPESDVRQEAPKQGAKHEQATQTLNVDLGKETTVNAPPKGQEQSETGASGADNGTTTDSVVAEELGTGGLAQIAA